MIRWTARVSPLKRYRNRSIGRLSRLLQLLSPWRSAQCRSLSSNIFARLAISTSHCSNMRSPVFTLDNSFGSAFGDGQRIGWRNAQVVGYSGRNYVGGGRRRNSGVTSLIFHYASMDEQMIAKIGALVGQSADGIDVEFAINPSHDPQSIASGEAGIFLSFRPTYSQRFRRMTACGC